VDRLRNTLLDNSEPFQLASFLKKFFLDPCFTNAMVATGYLDIPGLALVYDEIRAFLERPGTSFKLLIGQEPIIRSYQKQEPQDTMDFPGEYMRRDLAELNLLPEYDQVVKLLLTYLSPDTGEGKLKIKLYGQKDKEHPQFLHAKCYIFSSQNDSIGILGSSNFTHKGLMDNAELNYLETESAIVAAKPGNGTSTKGHILWFDEKWEESEDWNLKFFEEVRHSPVGKKVVLREMADDAKPVFLPPYETYIKFLIDQFGNQIDTNWKNKADFLPKDPSFKKLEYQIQAVNQAFHIMNKHNGMILADVVGLGKTFVGIMIIKRYLIEYGTDRPVLIITPPAIKKNWISSVDYFDKDSNFKIARYVQIITIGSIDRITRSVEEESEYLNGDDSDTLEETTGFRQNNFALILVDESHRFRNHDTNMYRSLQETIARTSPQAKVVLLSATPQNNRPLDLRNQIGLFQLELRNSTLDTLGETYGRNLESYFSDKQNDYYRLMKTTDSHGVPKTKKQIDTDRLELKALFKDIRYKIIEPLCVRRTRHDIEQYFKDDMEKQRLKFPTIREPEKLEYKMNENLARLFYDTVTIIAPSLSRERVSSDGNLTLDMTDETKVLGYYRYRAIEYLADPKDKSFYEKHNLKVTGISDRLAQMMEIHLVKRLESSFTAFKESLRNLKRYCENMITMLDDNTVFICPDLDINAELSPERQEQEGSIEMCYKKIERKMQRKDERNRKFPASAFVPEYRKLLENDREIIDKLIHRWEQHETDPKLDTFLHKIGKVFFDPKINNPHSEDKKLIIFTEAIPTVKMLADHLDSSEYEGKVLAITSENLPEMREIVAANFDANYDGEKRNDYEILITTDVLAEGVNLHRSNVILNYDSPWNSTRLMQRLGRINRIGSEADFINVYNFYPSVQGDAEINIVKRAWNKIQAFHELFGEDSKIFSKEEELVIHELIQHEEDEGDASLKYVEELKRFKSKHPARYIELDNLSGRVLSARKTDNDNREIIVQMKNAVGDDFCYSYTDKATFISKAKMLEKLECTENEMAANIDNKFYQESVKIILDCFTTERQNEKVHLRTKYSSKKQKDNALDILRTFVKNKKLSEGEKATFQDISQAVKNGNNSLIREIHKTPSPTDFSIWTKYINIDNVKKDEVGIVTLVMECQNEH
jgi:superfamily II DNA or RNA helicase